MLAYKLLKIYLIYQHEHMSFSLGERLRRMAGLEATFVSLLSQTFTLFLEK